MLPPGDEPPFSPLLVSFEALDTIMTRRGLPSSWTPAAAATPAITKPLRSSLCHPSDMTLACIHQEARWNPYYAHLALKLAAAAKSHRFTLQYCLWDQVSAVFSTALLLILLESFLLRTHATAPQPVRLSTLHWHHLLVLGPSCQKRNALVQTEILISY